MKNLALQMLLACVLVLVPTVAAFGQQSANQEANAQNAVAYSNLANAKLGKGDLDGAIADCDRAIQLDPKLPGAYINRGYAKLRKGELDAAIADCDQAIKLNPKLDLAFNDRG